MSVEALALDVYGTLIDPHAIVTRLREYIGDAAPAFSQLWRSKQLEFSFRRGLMQNYDTFTVVTRDALIYVDATLQTKLADSAMQQLLDAYLLLVPYPEISSALRILRERGLALYAFSNGFPEDLAVLLEHAGLTNLLDGIVSVHDVQSFKPDPAVYEHFCTVTGASPSQTRLVSSNGFDISGANACGWQTAWLKRDTTTVFDGWDEPADVEIKSLSEL